MADVELFKESSVRRPRARLLAGGLTLGGVVSASVTTNSFYAADKWSVVLAMGPDPERDRSWWGKQDEIEVEVLFGFIKDGGTESDVEWTSFLTGTADRIEIDEGTGLINLDGKDFTQKLIEAQIVDAFPNMSVGDIVRKFAGEHGLTADVDEPGGLVGHHYVHDHGGVATGEFSRQTTEWDYLCELAQQHEGYRVWVSGRVLHFKKAPDADKENPIVIRYVPPTVIAFDGATVRSGESINCTGLKCTRDLTRAKDIEVVVRL